MTVRNVMLALVLVALAGCTARPHTGVYRISFEESILMDAEARFPDADIIEIEGTEQVGEFNITNVRVTFNSTSICPVRMRIRYKYPTFGYEIGVPTYIVKDCKYECSSANCVIAGEEQAIVAAHTLPGTTKVREFVYSSADVQAHAQYLNDSGVWSVTFTKGNGEKMTVNITARNPTVEGISSQ